MATDLIGSSIAIAFLTSAELILLVTSLLMIALCSAHLQDPKADRLKAQPPRLERDQGRDRPIYTHALTDC